jgi:penicillin amidase
MRVVLLLALVACKRETPADEDPSPLLEVDQTGAWTIPGLHGEAQVVNDAYGVPWIYAEDREDLGRVLGFVTARDRFFYMDLARRLSQGKVSALLGADALETDIESRMTGMGFITERILGLLEGDPEMKAFFEAYAEGINASITEVQAGNLPPPTEYDIAAPLLGKEPAALLEPFTLRDVVAGMTTFLYESGFETKDIGRASDALRLAAHFDGAPYEAFREAGLLQDAWNRTEPVFPVASAPDWTARPTARVRPGSARRSTHVPPVHADVLHRLRRHTDRIERRYGHDWQDGFGSNAWAVDGAHSADGRALLASDGHLQLAVPPLFYQLGLDTQHLGGGDIHQVGMITPAMPLLSTGTNGQLAFGQTQIMGDITDWYTEQLVLDANGAPLASKFKGEDQPLQAFSETFTTASIPLLGSAAQTVTVTRYTTFDGRWITSVEGRPVGGPDEAGDGETAINLLGDWVVPADLDQDGLVTAVSFDYAGLDLSNMASTIDRYTKAENVDDFATATHDLVAYSLNLVAADASGRILYTGFQAIPCREYLDRDDQGVWIDGADPNLLLDGTRYPGFTIPITDGRVDFSFSDDPQRCVIPFEDYPHSFDPAQGWLVSANNDPGGTSFDGSLTNDAPYIGGPWIEGYRADEIARELTAATAVGATLDDMMRIQGDHTSVIGRQLTPVLLDAIEAARALQAGDPGDDALESTTRTRALYAEHAARFDEAATRLQGWSDRGWSAESGVATFYQTPSATDVEDAVATTIFNAWMGRYLDRVVKDEGMPGLGWPTGATGEFRLLKRCLEGRGPNNPADLGSWMPETEESVFFDDRRTPELETSDEVALLALRDALDFLATAPNDNLDGGFGTADMDAWLWGLRHRVRFTSLLSDFFDADDPIFGALIAPLNITPDLLPLAEGMAADDPRADLPAFPRDGDHLNVDAANSGTNGVDFDYGDGPVFRFVTALGPGGFEAYNVIPGGQSGLNDSAYFADQARKWLGNEVIPLPLDPKAVAAQGVGREVFSAP